MTVSTLINGRFQAEVPATDRGLLFGDGLFETMGFRKGTCPLWDRHMRRLLRGCQMLGISAPDLEQLDQECQRLAKPPDRVVIRITLTRGSGGRGYWPEEGDSPTRIVQSRGWPEGQARAQEYGLRGITSSLRINPQPALAGLKHCNRIEQVLAARECLRRGAEEALVFDQNDRLAEAISSNLLLRHGNAWITPVSPAAVAGVGLEWLLSEPPVPIHARAVERAELDQVDSILVINSIGGIRPLCDLDHRDLIIDQDCRRLQHHWNQQLIPVCDDF